MPFMKEEAADWASWVGDRKDELSGRPVTYEDVSSLLDTLLESIGRDAELGGWYCEWEEMSNEAYRIR